MDTFSTLLPLAVGLVIGAVVGVLWARSRGVERVVEQALDQAELMQGLDRLSDQVHHLDRARERWQGEFSEQVDTLRRETQSLSTALRRPQVRGQWGELHLRRSVELAGMVDHCDFTEQVRLADGAQRPDLVVHLAGGRTIVVDAKVPLDAFLDAGAADDEDAREGHLARHARQVRQHVDGLGAKRYWQSLAESPEFVVLFLPSEAFLSAALTTDPSLIEYAAARQVVLATPTTLIALLRTVAHGWRHESLATQARQVHELGRELHGRLAKVSGHLDALGRSLNATVGHYNQAVGSFESRVLVSARRFEELDVTDDRLESPRQLDTSARATGLDGRDADVRPLRRAAHDGEVTEPTVLP